MEENLCKANAVNREDSEQEEESGGRGGVRNESTRNEGSYRLQNSVWRRFIRLFPETRT